MLSNPSVASSGGRERPRIHIDRQKIVDHISIFGAVQAMQRGSSRVGSAAAGLSRRFSVSVANPSSAARSGRAAPLGGIIPVLILRITFSQVAASLEVCE